jgi:nucleotide-binding universal stress UspA family protein
MGTHGRSGVAHLMLGSVAERLVRTAPCPVLTVRDTARVSDALANTARAAQA